jgi:enamine deaminase RidA (YjgF/YER057c/UK114 family)
MVGALLMNAEFSAVNAQEPRCPSGPAAVAGAINPRKTLITPPSLPNPSAFAYSNGVRMGNLLFLAGQTDDFGSGKPAGNFEAQTRRTFEKINTVLEAAGGSLNDLVTMTVFLVDPRYGAEFLKLRREILKGDFPASALISIDHLFSPELLLEIQSIAVLPCR